MPITAWQYLPNTPIPLWVLRRWHKIGSDEQLECVQSEEVLVAHPTDMIVCLHGFAFVVLCPEEFNQQFESLEVPA